MRQNSKAMLPIKGIYEIAIKVGDLSRAERFYCDVLNLEVGIRDDRRNWIFLRAGGDAGMIVLQEDKTSFSTQHFAFTVDESDIENVRDVLSTRGVEVSEVMFHEWMPAKSIYFNDPDGNALELCAPVK
mgnify:CR=1 FL=1